jgi:DNA-cytosine methyltransferase
MEQGINVLSLFDGLSGARVALDIAGIKVKSYHACEIEPSSIKISSKNYPDIVHKGSVCDLDPKEYEGLDLLIGGSPCQSLSSFADMSPEQAKGLDGKSGLFFEYIRIWKEAKPKYFLLENVASMKDRDRDFISSILGVEPIMIDSALVGAQMRKRYYWTNIPGVIKPENRYINLQSVLESGYTEKEKSVCITATYYKSVPTDYFMKNTRQFKFTSPVRKHNNTYIINDTIKVELNRDFGTDYNRAGIAILSKYTARLTPIECERLQGLPDNYTEGVSTTKRYEMIGNGFTSQVIAHILGFMKSPNPNNVIPSMW